MDILSSIFINADIDDKPAYVSDEYCIVENGAVIRLFCKELQIDNKMILAYKKNYPEDVRNIFKKMINENRMLRYIAGKKVYLQYLKDFHHSIIEYDRKHIRIDITYENSDASLILNESNSKCIYIADL